jgi:iron complex outermembrane recepter protein
VETEHVTRYQRETCAILRVARHCAVAALLLAGFAHTASAQAQQDSARRDVIRVGEISVQAARAVTTAGGASALEVQLDSMALRPAPTLEEVLRELPLIQVRTNSRGEAQFSLRGSGSDARQVAVLMDGVPLNLGWDDRADLSVLPATAATSLTLVRGLPSVLHGPNVLGGVLEVGVGHHPGRWMPPAATHVSAGVESTGAWSAGAAVAVPVRLASGRFAVRAGAGYRDRPGLAVPDAVVQPEPAHDLRTNTDLLHRDGFLALRYLSDTGAWATLASSAFVARRGIPAELHTGSPRFWRYPHISRTVAVLSGGTGDHDTPLGGVGDLEASVGIDVGRTEIVAYGTGAYNDPTDYEDGDDVTLTFRLLGDHTLGSAGDLRGAFTLADIRHDERLANAAGSIAQTNLYRQRIWSVGAEAGWTVGLRPGLFRHLRLSAGGALDGADTPDSGDKPALGRLSAWGGRLGVTAPTGDGGLLVHAGLSRRARFPALRELYSGALGRFEPNPALRPEQLVAAEAGLTTRLPTGELQLVGFYRSLSDAIERVTLPDRRFQRVNRGEARSAGVELMTTLQLGAVALSGDLTLQQVRLFEGGARHDEHPEYQPDIVAGVRTRVALPFDARAGATARYVGRQYCADPNGPGEVGLDASTRFDLDASRSLGGRRGGRLAGLELTAAIDNVGDAVIYDQCGLPQPGRTLRLQLRTR